MFLHLKSPSLKALHILSLYEPQELQCGKIQYYYLIFCIEEQHFLTLKKHKTANFLLNLIKHILVSGEINQLGK